MDMEALVEYPIHEQIALRAYQFWEERGQPWGTPEIDWLKAECDLASVESESTLSRVAREVGSVVGRIVAIVSDVERS
jgi:hypothetical protein